MGLMAGLKLVVPTTFTDTSLAILRDDPILSSGSLLLVDPSHSAAPWPAGVPANLATVPNIAKASAKTILGGSPTDAAVSPIWEIPIPFTANKGLVARSSKGGLDLLYSPTLLVSGNEGGQFQFPTALRQYIFDHLDNDYFISSWMRITRVGSTDIANGPTFVYNQISATSGSTNNFLTYTSTSAVAPSIGNAPCIGSRNATVAANIVGPACRNIGVNAFTNVKPVTAVMGQANTLRTRFGTVGRPVDSTGAASHATCPGPSYVLYRFYLEDLTVSGRSYTDVDAIDVAEYNKQVLTAGGRYYGDTFTDPTTIP